jgi:hypothetical protein
VFADRGFAKPTSTLIADVERVLSVAQSRLGVQTDALRTQLHQPLTIAVAGRTNSGKSTLVNALIGHRIAPTRATECTKVTTWFRFGAQETARVVHTDGTTRTLTLTDDGMLPDHPGSPLETVDRIEVWRSYEPLRGLTIVDTPGLFGDEELAAHTEELLAGDAVDVLLFVYSGALTDYEITVLKKFRRASRRVYDCPVNAFGVLSRADLLGDQETTWANARAIASRTSQEQSDQLCGVLPVIGKIAETTETGRFSDTQAGWLRALTALPADELHAGLFDHDEFAELECGIPLSGRMQLMERLDMYGIRALVDTITADTPAAHMASALRAMSGIADLRDRIQTMFVHPAVVHKTARVLGALKRAAAKAELDWEQQDWLDDAIAGIRSSASMHTIDELCALAAIHSGRCDLPPDERERAIRLFSETRPHTRLGISEDAPAPQAAADAERHWKTIANSAIDPQVRMVAGTAAWSAALIHQSWDRT